MAQFSSSLVFWFKTHREYMCLFVSETLSVSMLLFVWEVLWGLHLISETRILCLCVCCICVSLCLCVPVSMCFLYLCLCLCFCVCVCVCSCVCICVCVCVYVVKCVGGIVRVTPDNWAQNTVILIITQISLKSLLRLLGIISVCCTTVENYFIFHFVELA